MPDKSKSLCQQILVLCGNNREGQFQRDAFRTCSQVSLFDWLTEEFERGNCEPVRAVFQSIEELLGKGDLEVRDQGLDFLQSLQEAASPKPCGIEAFVQFFGPETSRLWLELNTIWRTAIKLDDLERSVLEAEVLAYRISRQVLRSAA